MFGTVRYKLLVSSTCNRRQHVRKGDGRPELFEQLLRETSDFSRAAGWPSPVLFFIPSFFLQIWPSLLLLSQEVATLTPSDISVTEVGLKHNTLFKNPTKSKNAIKLQTLQLWCRWSGKRSLLQTHRHWLGISGWRVQREVKQKGLSKMKRIKQKIQQVKSSAEKYFHSPPPPPPPPLFFPYWHLHVLCQTLIFPRYSTDNENTHTSCQGITGWTCLPFSKHTDEADLLQLFSLLTIQMQTPVWMGMYQSLCQGERQFPPLFVLFWIFTQRFP